ncbi:MAG: hypothetical protein RIQ52_3 [Pseudomonadota bacterium]|jgi:uncharacterized membrane protein YidH (DUF202 family)
MAFDIKKMTKREFNVGLNDSKIRYVAGTLALLTSVFLGNILLLLAGGILVASAYLRWCPAYSAMEKTTVGANEPIPEKGCCHHGDQNAHH